MLMKKRLLSLVALLAFVGYLTAQEKAYLFSYFIEKSRDGLHLAYSYDGLTWTPLNNGKSFLVPTVGKDKLMRDPSICQAPDGTFHMVWTSSWTDRIIGYASSPDLIHWSEQQAIPVMMHEPTAHNCWAPELFYDEPSKTYYIFWATTLPGRHKEIPVIESEKGLNHRMYYVTTQDFKTFSETKLFLDTDFSAIDAAIAVEPTTKELIMVIKNENSLPAEKNVRVTRTTDIRKGFPVAVSPSISGDSWAEGPAPLFVGNDLYVYFDKYREGKYGAVRSKDKGYTWEDVSNLVSFPRGTRHGTAFTVDKSIVDQLVHLRQFNPIIPDHVADPSLSKFGDTFYLFGTTDIDRGLGKAGTPVVWKSTDFVNWSFEGSHIEGFDWEKSYSYTDAKGEQKEGYYRYWAPGAAIEKEGKYYFYPTYVKPNEESKTYVMVADTPEGPYRFVKDAERGEAFDGLLPEASCVAPDIDGEPFIDTDGTGYIYWRRRMAAQLSEDLIQTVGNPILISTARQGYSEGPIMFKRKGIYYYIYTLRGNQNYANAYMMSRTSPLADFETPAGNDIFLFSSPATNIWGPGHGNVFYNEETDDYLFLYLEYGDGGTTRQTFVNRMEFNEDGTIRTLVPDRWGVGYLAANQEPRENLALKASFTASTTHEARTAKVAIETQPNAPLADKASEETVERTRRFLPAYAADCSNGTAWQASTEDKRPWLLMDLKSVKQIHESKIAFVHPAQGHAWRMEYSADGVNWSDCATQAEVKACSPHSTPMNISARFLRLWMEKGTPGIWEWQLFGE